MEWYAYALISALLSAAAAITEKKALFKISALEFSVVLSLFSFIFSIPFITAFSMNAVTLQALTVLFIKSIFNAAAFYCVMSALKRLDISNSLPLMNLTPGLVAIAALIFLRELLNIWQSGGLVLLMAGTYMLNVGTSRQKSFFSPFSTLFKSTGHRYILFALFAFTLTSVLDKVIVGNFRMPPEAFVFFQQSFNLFLFAPLFFIIKRGNSLSSLKTSWKNCGKYILLVAILTIGYRYTQILAVATGKVALVLALKRLSIFFACMVGGTLFKEIDLKKRLAATLILIAGALMVVML